MNVMKIKYNTKRKLDGLHMTFICERNGKPISKLEVFNDAKEIKKHSSIEKLEGYNKDYAKEYFENLFNGTFIFEEE